MADKYLDLTGLTYLWNKIKAYIQSAVPSTYAGSTTAGGVANKTAAIPYGTVDSTSTDTVITATVAGITSLSDGVCCYIKNGVVTSASGWTLNVNNLGAKPVYSSMAAASRSTTIFNINYTMMFIYNSERVSGGCWDVFYGYDSNTNTIGYQIRTNSLSLPVSGATYRYRLLFTSADGTKFVPANTSTSTNATSSRAVNQTPIDPFGRIVYYSYTTALSADSRPGASYLWEQYAITFGYSFNLTGAALTLTPWTPVYIKCAPQANGSAIIDSTTPYVQALPSTEDGKIYIFLGVAYSTTNVELTLEHPVYYYKNGAIRQWTNAEAIPTKTSDLTNDSGFITSYTETDPTVPSWAKAASKPSYTSDEVSFDDSEAQLGSTVQEALETLDSYNTGVLNALSGKQATLVSGTNIKTINNNSILGSGNLSISGGGGISTLDYEGEETATITSIEYSRNGDTDNLELIFNISGEDVPGHVSVPSVEEFQYFVDEYSPLPSVTSSDNGKLLQVQNGSWSISSQLPLRLYYTTIASGSISTSIVIGQGTYPFYEVKAWKINSKSVYTKYDNIYASSSLTSGATSGTLYLYYDSSMTTSATETIYISVLAPAYTSSK